jgi:hypothetical protein
MRKKSCYAILAVIAALAWSALPAQAQFDVGGSFYRTFSTSTSGNGTAQKPTNSYGGMVEGRYIKSTFLGAEVTYSYNAADQSLAPTSDCGFFCNNQPRTVPTKQNEASVDWVVSKKLGNLRPFAVAGFGFMINIGSGNGYALNTAIRPTYIAGGGTDWGFSPRFGLRLQFRDNFYKAPNVTFAYPTTGKFTQTAEPMIGVYFRL